MSDTISRQAAIDATWFEPSYTDPLNVLTEVRDRLKALPSAQPERDIPLDYIIDKDGNAICPKCGTNVEWHKYCEECGQALKWKESNE